MPSELPRSASLAPRPHGLLVDVGFTLLSFDGATIARHAAEAGVEVTPAAIEATEPTLRAELAQHDWPQSRGSTAPKTGGAMFFTRMLRLAGARGSESAIAGAAAFTWQQHLQRNVWLRVLPGATAALGRLRSAGVRMAVVSNSEGTVEALLGEVGMAGFFDAIVDSWHVGMTKPDPRIYAHALGHLAVPAADAMMVGDSLRADVEGPQAVGVRGVLLDPCDLYRGHTDVPRFATFAAFADAVLATAP